jgi:predicted membrane channel-forming protein YqfA (hemolysin III family)
MLLSTAYHVFGCHSERRRKLWLRADLTGVSIGLLGLYLSGVYTSFYHYEAIIEVFN